MDLQALRHGVGGTVPHLLELLQGGAAYPKPGSEPEPNPDDTPEVQFGLAEPSLADVKPEDLGVKEALHHLLVGQRRQDAKIEEMGFRVGCMFAYMVISLVLGVLYFLIGGMAAFR